MTDSKNDSRLKGEPASAQLDIADFIVLPPASAKGEITLAPRVTPPPQAPLGSPQFFHPAARWGINE